MIAFASLCLMLAAWIWIIIVGTLKGVWWCITGIAKMILSIDSYFRNEVS